MVYYLNIVTSLLTQAWYFPLLLLITCCWYFVKRESLKTSSTTLTQGNDLDAWLAAIISFIVLSAPFWILRTNAPHGGSDDAAMTLQTYLSASRQGDSINWTNSMLGGMDRWLLPNCHPLSLGRIYALFLKQPYQLYLFIIGINVISVFIFSWKIQIEFLRVRRWMAYIGSVAAVLTEGYWLGKYPDAHVSNGHGFAVIIVGIYWLTRFQESSKLWIVSLLVGLAFCMGSWIPFHNLPPLLATITIWGLIFWGRGAWLKVIQANALIIATFIVVLFPQFLAMKLLYSTTGRSGIYRPTVDLAHFYTVSEFVAVGVVGVLGAIFKIYEQRTTQKVLLMFLAFTALPLVAHVIEISKIIPAFRWELLYAGNEAWLWLAIVFFMDKIQETIASRWRLAGILSALLISSLCWTLIVYTWMGSLWNDLDNSYPSGNWQALTDTSISSVLKKIDPGPMRVAGIDDTNDMHFWGQFQGLEPIIGYTPFINGKFLYFWWFCAMMPSTHGAASSTGIVSIPVPVQGHYQHLDFPVPLSALINPDAFKLTNVDWIISHHPLYPMPGLQLIMERQGQAPACTDRGYAPDSIGYKPMHDYWEHISCYVKDYGYQRSYYVYHLQGDLPRAYLAAHVLPWPTTGQIQVLSQQELALAAQKTAFVDYKDWMLFQDQNSNGMVDIDNYQSDYMHLRISTGGRDALLVIASSLNPYWRILVDGKPARSFDVNGFQTGIWVHPENQEAQLIYCPPFRPQEHPFCSQTPNSELKV